MRVVRRRGEEGGGEGREGGGEEERGRGGRRGWKGKH